MNHFTYCFIRILLSRCLLLCKNEMLASGEHIRTTCTFYNNNGRTETYQKIKLKKNVKFKGEITHPLSYIVTINLKDALTPWALIYLWTMQK